MGVELIDLPRHSDDRGHLVALTGSREVPFEIRRVFYIFGNTAARDRAGHASRVTSELLVALHGSVRAVVDDGLGEGLDVVLDRPDRALAIGPMTWIELTGFSPDCVLLVLADTEYDPADQILHRLAFLASVQ